MVGIYGVPGLTKAIFTPTEAAAVAAVYAFLIANFIYRDMGPLKGRPWLEKGEEDVGLLGMRIWGFTLVTLILYGVGCFVMGFPMSIALWAAGIFLVVALILGALMAQAVKDGWEMLLAVGSVALFGFLPMLAALWAVWTSDIGVIFQIIQSVMAVLLLLLPPTVFVFAVLRAAERLAVSGASYDKSVMVGATAILRSNFENVVMAIPALVHKDTKHTLLEAGKLTIMLMFIIANALILKHVLTDEQIPQHITEVMLAAGLGPITFLIIVNIILLIGGQFMEPSGLIVIVAPLVFPIAIQLGIDPIHLGIIMVVNMEIGMITPPVGLNLFVTSGVANMSMMRVVRAALPFLAVLFVFLILVTYIPWLSTALPTAYMGPEIITN